jgi:hypothetical protein
MQKIVKKTEKNEQTEQKRGVEAHRVGGGSRVQAFPLLDRALSRFLSPAKLKVQVAGATNAAKPVANEVTPWPHVL